MREVNFKHTEIGLIPHDWEVKTLGDCIEYIRTGLNPRIHFKLNTTDANGYYITVRELNGMDIVIDEQTDRINHQAVLRINERSKLKIGDVLFSGTGTIGRTALVKSNPTNWGIKEGIYAITPNRTRLDSIFLIYYLHTPDAIYSFSMMSTGSTIISVPMTKLEKFTFPLPPSLAEQERIAGALSSIDTLIGALNEQIEKKQHIKQGTMQQLLTGKKRLAGFTGEWKSVRLGDVTDIRTGKRNGDENVKNGQYPFFVRSQTIYRINTYSYDGEAILIPGEGGIGSIFHYINGKFDYHQRVYKISDFADGIYAKYVYFYMKYSFGVYAMQNTVKATVDSLRLPIFQDFMVSIPPTIAEQSAIAAVLSGMDTEIAALEQKRDKYIAIKSGMMQDLLTGKIRLV